ncbi:TIGR02530 family flagellar biosynthesis protein [Bacillaceae bacterium S4-13-58]
MDHRIHHLAPQPLPLKRTVPQPNTDFHGVSFKDILQQESDLKISKHATQRMEDRNITIDSSGWEKINRLVSEARSKGITDSLVVTKDAALIVSAKNKTVVTAMDRKEASSQIFTNINGTILVD